MLKNCVMSMEAIHVWYAKFDVCHTKFDICCMPCFKDLCQFFNMLHAKFDVFGIIIRLWCAQILACFSKTLPCNVNFNTSCMIIGSGMFKFVHVASPVIYAILRLPLLLYRLFSFLAYQLPYVACEPNKFTLYQNLSTAPLFSVIPYSERLSSLAEAWWS